jgi:hypothetical protein
MNSRHGCYSAVVGVPDVIKFLIHNLCSLSVTWRNFTFLISVSFVRRLSYHTAVTWQVSNRYYCSCVYVSVYHIKVPSHTGMWDVSDNICSLYGLCWHLIQNKLAWCSSGMHRHFCCISCHLPMSDSLPASFNSDCSNVSMSVLHCSTVQSFQFCAFWINRCSCSAPISLPFSEYLKQDKSGRLTADRGMALISQQNSLPIKLLSSVKYLC